MRFFLFGPRFMGIRPGVSFSPNDLVSRNQASSQITGSFVYVLRGDHNMVKIGVTTNPAARLATLRTGSAFPIDFAFLAATPGDGFDIEQAAHAILSRQRVNGEWFDVSPEMAIAAVTGASAKLGRQLLPTDEQTATKALAEISRIGPLQHRSGGWSLLIWMAIAAAPIFYGLYWLLFG